MFVCSCCYCWVWLLKIWGKSIQGEIVNLTIKLILPPWLLWGMLWNLCVYIWDFFSISISIFLAKVLRHDYLHSTWEECYHKYHIRTAHTILQKRLRFTGFNSWSLNEALFVSCNTKRGVPNSTALSCCVLMFCLCSP